MLSISLFLATYLTNFVILTCFTWLLSLLSDLPCNHGLAGRSLSYIWPRLLSLDLLALIRCCGIACFTGEDTACLVVTPCFQFTFPWGAVLAAPWHYHACISIVGCLHFPLWCNKLQQHLTLSLLLSLCHGFVVIFCKFTLHFPLIANADLYFIAQFEIFLWQGWHKCVLVLQAVEQNRLTPKLRRHLNTEECVGAQFY